MIVMARSQDDLRQLNELLHGRWVDADRISKAGDRVHIPLTARATARARERDFTSGLSVASVSELTIDDSERIGFYDLERLELDVDLGALRVICNIPLGLVLQLKGIPVRIELQAA